MASHRTALHLLKLLLQLFDSGMGGFQVFVQTISLSNQLLFPGSETLFLNLDLLCESLPESLFFLLEFRVVEFSGPGLPEFPGFHLLSAIGFVMVVFGGVDEIEHMGPDEDGPELLEVAMIFVLDFGNAPRILSALGDAAFRSLDILLTANHGKRHGSHESARMLYGRLIIVFNGRLIDLDALGFNDISNTILEEGKIGRREGIGLCDDWDQIDTCGETLHDFDIEWLQGVAGGTNEVEADVDSEVNLVLSLGLLLLQHVGFMLVVKELDDWHPGVAIVDIVAKAGGVDDSQAN